MGELIFKDQKIYAEVDNFKKKEVACRCCGRAEIESGSIISLQAFKYILINKFKKNVRIYCVTDNSEAGSGFRCPQHNKNEGGVQNSQHTINSMRDKSTAFDIYSPDLTAEQIYETALECYLWTTCILYKNNGFVHLDNRPRPFVDRIYSEIKS